VDEKMKIKILKRLLTFSLIFLVFLSLIQVQASIVWEENFKGEGLNDWDSYGWDMPLDYHETPIDPGFSVNDGVLRAPDYSSYGKKSNAIHDSTVAYGTWSFDWLVSSPAHIGIEFMLTDLLNTNYNYTGLHTSQMNYTGYAVLLISFASNPGLGLQAPGINLLKFKNHDNVSIVGVLDTHKFAANIVGSHNIEINRDLNGQFSVYYDSELTLQATDNMTTTSEKFGFTTWRGDSGIDNITVSDTDPGTLTTTSTATTTNATEGYVLGLLIPSFVVLIIYRKKVKK
jgi:hypothetical protein